jgi:hypothetical protein
MPEDNTTDLTVTVKFNSTLESNKGTADEDTKYAYQAQVTYDSVADAAKYAGRFTTWALQRRARKGELPVGKLILVNGEGEYAKSVEDQIAEEDDFAKLERMRAAIEAKIAARNAATAAEPVVVAPTKGKGKRQS